MPKLTIYLTKLCTIKDTDSFLAGKSYHLLLFADVSTVALFLLNNFTGLGRPSKPSLSLHSFEPESNLNTVSFIHLQALLC